MSERRTIVEQPRPFAGEKSSATGKHPPFRHLLRLVIAAAVLLIIVLGIITGYLEKWLWMRQLDYAGIFWTLLSVQWAMFGLAFVFAFLYLWVNLRLAARNSGAFRGDARAGRPAFLSGADAVAQAGLDFSPRLLNLAVVLVSAGVALLFALGFHAQWDTYLRFRYGRSFGVSDPLFGVDVGYYVFHLPFYQLLQTSVMLLTVLALAGVVLTCVFFGLLRVGSSGKIVADAKATSHLSVLLFILAANWGFGLYLDHYKLVYSTLGVVYGAGYAVDHVTRIALWVMVAVSVVVCVLLALNFFRPRFGALLVGSGIYVALCRPNPAVHRRLSKILCAAERIGARGSLSEKLHRVHAQGLPARSHPGNLLSGPGGVDARRWSPGMQDTIQNIRLWDFGPLLQTYQQTQAIRRYHQFENVGVDRYRLADGYHQVMLATRPLAGATCESANLGQPVSAVHPRL